MALVDGGVGGQEVEVAEERGRGWTEESAAGEFFLERERARVVGGRPCFFLLSSSPSLPLIISHRLPSTSHTCTPDPRTRTTGRGA